MVIQAGPGTGKTRTLTAKIAYLVSKKDIDPGSILALTFTNKAARELEQRIDKESGCEQGLVPFAKDGENIDNLEEERRLFYVAMTRAMDILCLTYAKKRSIYGKSITKQSKWNCFNID